MRKEVDAVERSVDAQRAAESARTATEIARSLRRPALPHERKAFDRFERAHENAGSDSVSLAGKIEAKRRAVYLVDVGAVRRPEERCIARALTGKGVTRRIIGEVGFGFDDAACRNSLFAIAHEDAAK